MKHPKTERTLVIIKPDGVQRGLIGEIIRRYEQSGLKLVGLKMVVPTKDFIEKHYLINPEWRRITGEKTIESYRKNGKKPPSDDPIKVTEVILNNLKKYLSSGPVVAMVWQGMHAVGIVRKITGGTEPLTSDVGTIRGDLTIDSYEVSDVDGRAVRNLIHASGTPEEAEAEIPLWFSEKELLNYRLISEAILYDVNLDGILE
ncbi:MAG: Nucleoside diphosphate kinase [Candidatus Jorgensenbacteria bacterium GW2011_GWA1_48_13]|uniref:nucleoside-diphosphate kinase n=2 Tax=Candidatus Joergenseniibacteriota TaxID=1752739 RepID=A0A0G1YKG0_9BACT|nr:MAG: Nucleoside diphosphate kinase [Candidatus Jorgensenbacteria bacterium GW2011_GWA1_48_13]KKU99089.1 MAG: Nucleoside diphosphate kinase [Candidatus Jorgensenbacteria bacterium GW2011_GWC1_48_8]KKW15502.1 MAG: Nucleoside diphosphate kinase [Candidatus Jorgensenbacteria bacterium GW2011_GWB1_50_10]